MASCIRTTAAASTAATGMDASAGAVPGWTKGMKRRATWATSTQADRLPLAAFPGERGPPKQPPPWPAPFQSLGGRDSELPHSVDLQGDPLRDLPEALPVAKHGPDRGADLRRNRFLELVDLPVFESEPHASQCGPPALICPDDTRPPGMAVNRRRPRQTAAAGFLRPRRRGQARRHGPAPG